MAIWLALVSSSAADDSLCRGQPFNRFVADPHSCPRYFLCRNNRSIPGICNGGLHFQEETQMCRYPDEAGCEITPPAPTTTPQGPIENWVCIGRAHNSFCADPRRCGSYFLCLNQIGRPANCPIRHWFHPILLFCTNPGGFCTPRENQCDNGVDANGRTCEETTTVTPTTTTTTTEIVPTTPSGPLELWVCIGRPNDSFRNHPSRCGSYFFCRNLIGTMAECPRRSWFNPITHQCVNPGDFCRPTELECDNGIDANGRNCESDRTTTTTTTTVATTTTTQTTPVDPSEPIERWICIGVSNNSLRGHPRLCGSFFVCLNNLGVITVCPRRSWFHPGRGVCTTPGDFCVPQDSCDNGVGTNCPNSSEESNESNKCKDSSGSSDSLDSNESGCNESGGGSGSSICSGMADLDVIANPSACGTFYLCMFEIGLPVECPFGMWFNPDSRICMLPGSFCTSNSSCDNGVGNGCTATTTEEPIIIPEHSTTVRF